LIIDLLYISFNFQIPANQVFTAKLVVSLLHPYFSYLVYPYQQLILFKFVSYKVQFIVDLNLIEALVYPAVVFYLQFKQVSIHYL